MSGTIKVRGSGNDFSALRAIEFDATDHGDWVFHRHNWHHLMNAMGHDAPTIAHEWKREAGEPTRNKSPVGRASQLMWRRRYANFWGMQATTKVIGSFKNQVVKRGNA